LARSLFFLILMSTSLPLRNHRILGFNSSTSRLSNYTRNLKYCKVVHLSRCRIRCIVNRLSSGEGSGLRKLFIQPLKSDFLEKRNLR
jgi:hypothetical protein